MRGLWVHFAGVPRVVLVADALQGAVEMHDVLQSQGGGTQRVLTDSRFACLSPLLSSVRGWAQRKTDSTQAAASK